MAQLHGRKNLIYLKIQVLEFDRVHRASYSKFPLMSYSPGGQEASVPEALIVVQERLLVIAEGGRSVGKRIRVIAIISCSYSSLS